MLVLDICSCGFIYLYCNPPFNLIVAMIELFMGWFLTAFFEIQLGTLGPLICFRKV